MANKKKPGRVKAPGGKSRPVYAENISERQYNGRKVRRTDKTTRVKEGDEVVTTTTTTWRTIRGKKRWPRPMLSACLLMPACR